MRHPGTASPSVELLGLPGAGKTRFCEALGAALVAAGTPAALDLRRRASPGNRLRSAGRVLKLLARRPGYCRRSLSLIRAAQPADRRWLAQTWLKRSSVARSSSSTARLTDAGIAQALWSLALRARGERLAEILSALAAEAPLADLVVVLQVDRDCLAQRLAERPAANSRLERLLLTDGGILDSGLRLLELVAATLGGRAHGSYPIEVLSLQNNDEADLRRNVDSIADLLSDA